jgi:subtilase family serine protease
MRVRALAATAALLPVAVLAALLTPAHAAGGTRAVLAGTRPAWAAAAQDTGADPGRAPVTARVYFSGQDRDGLARYARAVSDPHSPLFHHYLTPQQAQRRFGATPRQITRIRGWLVDSGFTVIRSTAHYLAVRGPVVAAQKAFGTRFHTYRRNAQVFRAPVHDATVPTALAHDVLTVTGLDNAPRLVHPADMLPPPAPVFIPAGPFSSSFGRHPAYGTPEAYGRTQPWALRGYDGFALRNAYGVTPTGLTGHGATIAVVDAYDSPTLGDDVQHYALVHGDTPYTPGQLIRVDAARWTNTEPNSKEHPDGCDAQGWYGEQTLDLEAAHAMAPRADLVYVGASSCLGDGLEDALQEVVDKHLADIVSNSWGEPESAGNLAVDAAYDHLFQQGAVEGIGFYFASGDSGDDLAATGIRQTSLEPSLPWVTAVGGTSLATDPRGGYAFETGWGNDRALLLTAQGSVSADGQGQRWSDLPGAFSSGAGGGTSRRTPEPWYQRGVVPTALSGAYGGRNRVVPDIAADADPNTGFLVGQTQRFPDGSYRYSEYRIGGTSLACPLIAGIQALVQEAQGYPVGFANPVLYARAASGAYHDVVDPGPDHPVAQVRNSYVNNVDASQGVATYLLTLGRDSSLRATPGYDDVTGLGSPSPLYLGAFVEP